MTKLLDDQHAFSSFRYMKDRTRVECAMPAVLLWKVAHVAAPSAPNRELLESLKDDLESACTEPFEDFSRERRGKLANRVMRNSEILLAELEDIPPTGAFLALIYWLKELIDADMVSIVEGSKFENATERLLKDMNDRSADWSHLDARAMRLAKQIGSKCAVLGLYH